MKITIAILKFPGNLRQWTHFHENTECHSEFLLRNVQQRTHFHEHNHCYFAKIRWDLMQRTIFIENS